MADDVTIRVAKAMEDARCQRHYNIPGDWELMTDYHKNERLADAQAAIRAMSQASPLSDEVERDEIDDVIERLEMTDPEAAIFLKATDQELTYERRRTAKLEDDISAWRCLDCGNQIHAPCKLCPAESTSAALTAMGGDGPND